jgi:peptidyl-prolyl cis-trans isomerase A (cyclophilin A)
MKTDRRLILTLLALAPLGMAGCGGSQQASAPAPPPAPPGPTAVVIETSMGTIELELYPDKAPKTVANFLNYVNKGFYSGTVFHRVIPGFMIQGGGMTPDMNEKPTDPPVENEAQAAFEKGLKNERGTVSMARTQDPNSATAQFFINVAENVALDYPGADGYGYAVFGKVTSGMDVVDKIVDVKTTTNGPHANVPVEPVLIKSAKVKEASAAGTPVGAGEASNMPAGANEPAGETTSNVPAGTTTGNTPATNAPAGNAPAGGHKPAGH